jgi:hypothetical protein
LDEPRGASSAAAATLAEVSSAAYLFAANHGGRLFVL